MSDIQLLRGLNLSDILDTGKARANLGRYDNNWIIDPTFSLWPISTSTTTVGYITGLWSGDDGDGSGAATMGRQSHVVGQTDVPEAGRYYYRHDQTTAASTDFTPELRHSQYDVFQFASRTITISFYARNGSGTSNWRVQVTQKFGTGGTPSSDVTTNSDNISVGDSWQRYSVTIDVPSISGKTIGTGGDDSLEISIQFPAAIGVRDVDNVQVELGNAATAFIKPNQESETDKLNAYLYAPTSPDFNQIIAWGAWEDSDTLNCFVCFTQKMAAIPSVTLDGTDTQLVHQASAFSYSSGSVRRASRFLLGLNIVATTTGATAGHAGYWQASASDATPIIADARPTL